MDSKLGELFNQVNPVEPSEWLLQTLEKARVFPLMNEKTKAERIVSPILLEITHIHRDKITFFLGENIDIDSSRDLAGPCDFFFALQTPKPYWWC
ncbi:MAG: hypothetical protein NW226_10200 [Microscillaceae bacterium]|nr:hypothetical protein [Microscillaceae bacterium]